MGVATEVYTSPSGAQLVTALVKPLPGRKRSGQLERSSWLMVGQASYKVPKYKDFRVQFPAAHVAILHPIRLVNWWMSR